MRLLAWLLVLVAMVATTGGLGYYKYLQISAAIAAAEAFPEPASTVDAVTVRGGEWSATTRAVGTVAAVRWVSLRNELAGTVTEVGFDSGSVVHAGDILVRLDTSEEEADLAAAEAEVDLAQRTVDRRKKLASSSAMSQADLDTAEAELRTSRALVARLQARIAKKTLAAPFDARVGIRDLQPGEYLAEGTLITTLQGVDEDGYVDFTLPQDLAVFVKVGDGVQVSSPAFPGKAVEAEIQAADPSVDDSVRSVRFRAVGKGLGGVLRPGSFVDVEAVVAPARPALFVPLTALRRAPYGDHVFALEEDADGKLRAHQRFVRTGPIQGADIVVSEGLADGDRIAANGSFKLHEGALVNVADPSSATAQVKQ